MKLYDFLRNKTSIYELCVICEDGYEVMTCWIDYEELSIIPSRLANRDVRRDYWDMLPIIDKNGNEAYVSCHYIDV